MTMLLTSGLVIAGVFIVLLIVALAAEIRKNLAMGAEIVGFANTFGRLEDQHRHTEVRYQTLIDALTESLKATELHRDIRGPAHPILEYLIAYGPSTMAELRDEFGATVGYSLGNLLTESGHLQTDDEHHLWWVGPEPRSGPMDDPALDVVSPYRPLLPLTGWVEPE